MVNSRKARVPLRVSSAGVGNFGCFPFDYSQPLPDSPRNNRPRCSGAAKNVGENCETRFSIFPRSVFYIPFARKWALKNSAAEQCAACARSRADSDFYSIVDALLNRELIFSITKAGRFILHFIQLACNAGHGGQAGRRTFDPKRVGKAAPRVLINHAKNAGDAFAGGLIPSRCPVEWPCKVKTSVGPYMPGNSGTMHQRPSSASYFPRNEY